MYSLCNAFLQKVNLRLTGKIWYCKLIKLTNQCWKYYNIRTFERFQFELIRPTGFISHNYFETLQASRTLKVRWLKRTDAKVATHIPSSSISFLFCLTNNKWVVMIEYQNSFSVWIAHPIAVEKLNSFTTFWLTTVCTHSIPNVNLFYHSQWTTTMMHSRILHIGTPNSPTQIVHCINDGDTQATKVVTFLPEVHGFKSPHRRSMFPLGSPLLAELMPPERCTLLFHQQRRQVIKDKRISKFNELGGLFLHCSQSDIHNLDQ